MTTSSWHAAALHDLENTSMSVAAIAEKYKRSHITVQKLLQRSKIVRNNKAPKGPRRRDNSLPLSREHHAIGIRISMARGPDGVTAYADKLGVSPITLTRMEAGQYDFKLSQLVTISEAINQSIPDMMMSFDKNLYVGRPNARN